MAHRKISDGPNRCLTSAGCRADRRFESQNGQTETEPPLAVVSGRQPVPPVTSCRPPTSGRAPPRPAPPHASRPSRWRLSSTAGADGVALAHQPRPASSGTARAPPAPSLRGGGEAAGPVQARGRGQLLLRLQAPAPPGCWTGWLRPPRQRGPADVSRCGHPAPVSFDLGIALPL